MNTHLAIISLIEGITEFLPISSTAHLILFSKFSGIDLTDAYIKFYLLFIQFGALLAGVILFSKKIFTNKDMFTNIVISFIPSAVFGFIFYKLFKQLLEGNIQLLVLMLILGGVIFIYLEKVFVKKVIERDVMTKQDALLVGLAQAIAIIPGVSRSGATIIAGMFRGIKKAVIVEYTFILALPTLGAAVVYDAYKNREMLATITSYQELFFGFVIAFIVAFITLSLLKKYLPRISLTAFGWYRIILGVFVLMWYI
ncbi:MAG: undecaprenyl-diphosphate phosphatase [Patescibacteria group bacterium]